MLSWKRYIPEGTRDMLFEECSRKIQVENILRTTYVNSGFLEVISPTLEFYDVFSGETSTLAQEKMYKLLDNQGRILVLRPDMTTPIARLAATKLKDAPHPLKLCYTSNIYRMNESLNGKNSEITQSGIELIGIDNIKADVEVIITGISALLSCGLDNFKIELGHAEFFKAIVEEANFEDEVKEKLRIHIENKNFTALSEFLEEKKADIDEKTVFILKELPKLFGNIEILDKASELTVNSRALDALETIRNVYKVIEDAELSGYLSVDLGMVQDLNYYTGIVFRGYAPGVGGNILSGGRYDKLIYQFGEEQAATGLAIDVDSILTALQNSDSKESVKEKILIYYKEGQFREAYRKAIELRRSGIITELNLTNSYEEAVKYAQMKGLNKIVKII
ncbi:ATP phosphoribosyltransferase regulatory subunit [Clostridium sp. A1-XYC3]|uniref:ATP phosphoribosyltransferase regulatory subunit n=1 Tax=Clostridium tanneri TaxID=3037988 RepID=A0ABU4JT95_9CLOT|nr:ATP phosphoribosyltransferase regulatory subunit [Clostridium sp. A1-XYC3]MDW8801171.1 ATP phosphoribosyltransferase regulatory subunit [Clostridium sp. A1-XYC3]